MRVLQPRLRAFVFLLISSLCISLTSCGEKIYDVSDTQWAISVFWDDGINTTMNLDFSDDLSLSMIDDTAGYDGSWSRNGQVVSWTVNVPGRQINARCTVDNRAMEGTLSDENELTAIFTGGALAPAMDSPAHCFNRLVAEAVLRVLP